MSYNEVKSRGTADFPVELYHLTEYSPKYNMAHHWHGELEIIWVISGKLCLNLNNYDYILSDGDVAFVNSEVVHGAKPENCEYMCIVFHPEGISAKPDDWQQLCSQLLGHELYINEVFTSETEVAKKCRNLFEEMKKQESSYSRLSCMGALFSLFGELQRCGGLLSERHTGSDGFYKNEHKLKKVLTFIRENFDKPISLEDMAKRCEMSPKYFCSYFKKMTKMSPTEYLLFYRVEKSARLLLKSDLSITETAYACGFADLSYFIKMFKRQMGMSPGKFRKWSNN